MVTQTMLIAFLAIGLATTTISINTAYASSEFSEVILSENTCPSITGVWTSPNTCIVTNELPNNYHSIVLVINDGTTLKISENSSLVLSALVNNGTLENYGHFYTLYHMLNAASATVVNQSTGTMEFEASLTSSAGFSFDELQYLQGYGFHPVPLSVSNTDQMFKLSPHVTLYTSVYNLGTFTNHGTIIGVANIFDESASFYNVGSLVNTGVIEQSINFENLGDIINQASGIISMRDSGNYLGSTTFYNFNTVTNYGTMEFNGGVGSFMNVLASENQIGLSQAFYDPDYVFTGNGEYGVYKPSTNALIKNYGIFNMPVGGSSEFGLYIYNYEGLNCNTYPLINAQYYTPKDCV